MLKKVDEILNLFSKYPDVQEMFRESEKCFKVEAYRAALLFAFSAFLKVLSRKIIENGQPSTVVEGEWNDVCQKLRADDSIEEQVLKCVQSKDNKYFQISSSLKEQMTSWKNLRNACAHWKNELIDEFVVQNFYSFILFNQYKFSLKTSAENAAKELFALFDMGRCPAAELEQKVRALPYLLADNEIDGFCKVVAGYPYSPSDESAEIVEAIVTFSDEKYKMGFVRFFRSNLRYVDDIIEKKNRLLPLLFPGDHDYEKLLLSKDVFYRTRQKIALLLKKRGELDESLLRVFFESLYNDDQHEIIDECNDLIDPCSDLLMEYIHDGKISYTSYGDVNSKADLIYQLLSSRTIDAEIVAIWNKFFPDNSEYSWHLRERFEYKGDDRKKYNGKLLAYAQDNKIALNKLLAEILNGNL